MALNNDFIHIKLHVRYANEKLKNFAVLLRYFLTFCPLVSFYACECRRSHQNNSLSDFLFYLCRSLSCHFSSCFLSLHFPLRNPLLCFFPVARSVLGYLCVHVLSHVFLSGVLFMDSFPVSFVRLLTEFCVLCYWLFNGLLFVACSSWIWLFYWIAVSGFACITSD